MLAGVGAVRSIKALDYMQSHVPGVEVPDHIFQRLRKVPPAQQTAEGIKLAAEIVQQVAEIPGVAGVHLLVAGNEQAVPAIVDRAGIQTARQHSGR